ncbi:MAG: GNAT family N-acetyltransferase [Coriobacteriales bacterium]|nr:GNAT family N-acetyltransferase [Coriobacteriales bacterium]
MSEVPETDEFELPFPQYRCPACGKDLPLTEARMTVTCAEHRPQTQVEFAVRKAGVDDRHFIEEICDRAIGETLIDVYDQTFDVLDLINFIVESEGEPAGLLSAALIRGDLAIVFFSVYPDFQGKGAGRTLLEAADQYAAQRSLTTLRAATTNDDIPQLYFLQRNGFQISDIAVGNAADRLGSAVAGFSGIPVRDEIHLHRNVGA